MAATIIGAIKLLGGLALFLFGMNLLGNGLEKLAGGSMEKVLQKLTSNPVKGVLLGAVITAAIQSSSATTVIVVGLVNAGILKLYSAVGVIMGANIGTTVTAQILRLGDLDKNGSASTLLQFMKPTTLAPLVAIVGIVIYMVSKRSKYKDIGKVLVGFGILFNGMFAMEAAVEPLKGMPQVQQAFATLTNPIVGVLTGAVVTGIIQSSSASVGILQALSQTGAITFGAAFPIIMGQNIGTCVTPIISSIGANKNAKRSAMVHLYFNIIGTVIFLIVVYAVQYTVGLPFWNSVLDRGGIANFHTIFNIITTCLLLPFSKLLAKLAELTIKDRGSDEDDITGAAKELDERLLLSPAVALERVKEAVKRMGTYACKNCKDAVTVFEKYDSKVLDRIKAREDMIDNMEDAISAYLVKLADKELSDEESRKVSENLHVLSEFERIGDYAINLTEQADTLFEKGIGFSDKAVAELSVVADAVLEIIQSAIDAYDLTSRELAEKIEPLEETIDMMVDSLKRKHIKRLKKGKCTVESGVNFLEVLTNIERMSDHCSNIAVYVLGYKMGTEELNHHEYISRLHKGGDEGYVAAMNEYKEKYLVRIE